MNQPAPFEILGHTADLRLYVTGHTLEELFRNALKGMASVIKPGIEGKSSKREIEIHSEDTTALLVDFLNEALYLSNVHKEVYTDASFRSMSEVTLEGELSGAPVSEFDEDIKAVTYHEAEIAQNTDGYYEVTLVFDI